MVDANVNANDHNSNHLIDASTDPDQLASQVDRKRFLSILQQQGVNISAIAEKTEMTQANIDKLNHALRQCHDVFGINIADCMIYLEPSSVDVKKLVQLLNAENLTLLTNEMAKRYHKERRKNTVSDFL